VNVPADGTVTVTTIPLSDLTTAASVYTIDVPFASGTGTMTYQAKAGPALIAVSIPPGSDAARGYQVSFTFQSKSQ
jgi:hypothetical protein